MSVNSSTLFSHQRCGGSLVLDLSQALKMVAPSFSIDGGGISRVVADLRLDSRAQVTPVWECTKCGAQITSGSAHGHLQAPCMICGQVHPISDLFTHERVVCVCKVCVDTIFKRASVASHPRPELLRDYQSMLGLSKNEQLFIPMTEVISKPFKV
jgi:hypothetical protein